MNDLIELARGDVVELEVEDFRLDLLAADCMSRARRAFPQVAFSFEAEPTVIEGVPNRLARAINNLLDNAAIHAGGRPAVELTVHEGTLQIRDHGDGIAENDLPHIFDRFYRSNEARGRRGSGLGLSIVHGVVAQHGAHISVDNATDGGAVFTIAFPRFFRPSDVVADVAEQLDDRDQ